MNQSEKEQNVDLERNEQNNVHQFSNQIFPFLPPLLGFDKSLYCVLTKVYRDPGWIHFAKYQS